MSYGFTDPTDPTNSYGPYSTAVITVYIVGL